MPTRHNADQQVLQAANVTHGGAVIERRTFSSVSKSEPNCVPQRFIWSDVDVCAVKEKRGREILHYHILVPTPLASRLGVALKPCGRGRSRVHEHGKGG
jgi:hypothetical protein